MPEKSGKRRRSAQICYDVIGFITLSGMMEKELAGYV